MTSGERGFLIFLIINFIIVLLYLLYNFLCTAVWEKEGSRSTFLKATVMLLCPGAGVGFMIFGYLFHRILFYRDVDLNDVVFSKERVKPQMAADEDAESNVVPIEEAINVTDRDNLRSMMLQVVQGDLTASLNAISMALKSDDSEAAHYAAVILQNVLNDFHSTVLGNYEQIMAEKEDESSEEHAERLRLTDETLDYMAEFMHQRLLPDNEQLQYSNLMGELCDFLYQEDSSLLSTDRYETVCMELLEAKDYETCRKWCLRAYAQYPDEAIPYTCQLKLYYETGEPDKFFRILNELRSSEIAIDNETLEMVRVFL